MTENFELFLRDQLVAFSQGRAEVEAVLDARFPFEAAELQDATQEKHLDSIRTHLSGRANGKAPSWLMLLLRAPSRQRPAAPRNWAIALVASAFLLVLLLQLQSPVEQRPPLAGGTPPTPKDSQEPEGRKDPPIAEVTEPAGSTKPEPQVGRRPGHDATESIAAKVEVGVFGEVMGEPTVRFEGGATAKALPKRPVFASSIIETGDTDNAEIRFADGTTVRMDFNTRIRLAQPPAPGKSGLRPDAVTLLGGRVSVVAAHLSNSETFSIKTDVATATVIGTRFSLGVSGAGSSQIAVLKVQEGKVQFSNEHGSVIAISKTESSATRDDAPTRPRRLSLLGQRRLGRNFIATWEAEPRANDEKEFSQVFVFRMGSAGIQTMAFADRGVLIVGLFPLIESPARAAGIQVGDVLTRFNGRQVASDKDLHRWIRLHSNQHVTATLEREGKVYETRFRLNEVFPANVTLRSGLISRLGDATVPALTGDPGRAVIMLRALVKRTPNAPVFNNLGMAQFMEDDMGAAIKSLKEAVRLAPETWLYRYNLGRALVAIGNIDRGVEELQKSLELKPDSAHAAVHFATALVETGRGDQAIAVLGKAIEAGNTVLLVNLSSALVDLSRFTEAVDAANEAIKRFPDLATAHIALSEALSRLGRNEEAETAVRAGLALNPGSTRALGGLGKMLLDTQRLAEAEAVLRKALSIDSGSLANISNLGNVLNSQGKVDEAESTYRKAIELHPLFAWLHHNYSVFLSAQGRLADAETAIRTAIGVGPPDSGFQSQLGVVLMNQGRMDEAEHHYERALELDSEGVTALVNLGVLLSKTNRLNEAEQLLSRAYEIHPKDAGAAIGLGIFRADQGRADEAEKLFRRAIELDPKSSRPYLELGVLIRGRGDLQAAESLHRKAVELDPKSALARSDLGSTLLMAGKVLEAEAECRLAIDLDPTLVPAHQTLGTALRLRGEVKGAEAALRRGIALDPKYVGLVTELAILLTNEGRLEEAAQYFKAAAAMSPTAESYANLATVYGFEGKLADAEAAYREALKRWPDDGRLLNNLADNLSSRNIKLEEARDLAERAVKASPADPYVRDTLGWIHYQLGEYEPAERRILECIQIAGSKGLPGVVWVHLGAVYEKKGDITKARDAYKQALAVEPTNKEAADALKRIGSQ